MEQNAGTRGNVATGRLKGVKLVVKGSGHAVKPVQRVGRAT